MAAELTDAQRRCGHNGILWVFGQIWHPCPECGAEVWNMGDSTITRAPARVAAPFVETWYRCRITELTTVAEEPDWSRVPEARRDQVRERWRAANTKAETTTVYLWGPQIPFFQRQSTVEVL